MLQVIQPIDGQPTAVVDVPMPTCGPGEVLIANRASLISAGTERSTVELARQSLLGKARQRPDHVRRVMEKVRQEGLLPTIRQVRARLGEPMPLGYSSAGVVLAVGANVREFRVGDRVASNGPHANVVSVPKNLVARVPDEVPFEHACYAVVGSIALQGVRLSEARLGDVVAVIGLGLIGQLTIALLRSAGCRVVATDIDPNKYDLARQMGAEVVGSAALVQETLTRFSAGADAVLITASTDSNGPVELAASLARDRARVVAVGAVGLDIPRREFYHKELEFVVSRSYGPGRYDPSYEEAGRDYPVGYVRWTEQRNIQAVLDQMARSDWAIHRLTSHRFAIEDGERAYALVESGSEPYLGIVLTYPSVDGDSLSHGSSFHVDDHSLGKPASPRKLAAGDVVGMSLLGAGGFASSTLAPTFARTKGFTFRGVVSGRGLSARTMKDRHSFAYAGAHLDELLTDEATDAVVIATRHHLHVPQGLAVLASGKHVFMEKPLAISFDQLDEWTEGLRSLGESAPIWMLGFNRRFSPPARRLRDRLSRIADAKLVVIQFNAGSIPRDHWVHDPDIGGGRLVGEACHAVDLAVYLIGSKPIRVYAESASSPEAGLGLEDNATILVQFADGSQANIVYTSAGDRSAGKERVSAFAGGMTGIIDDFRSVTIRQGGRLIDRKRWWSQQKGFAEEIEAFRQGILAGVMPIPADEMMTVTQTTLRAVQSLRSEIPLDVEAV